MKIVADEGIEKPIVFMLRVQGHHVIHIAEIAPGSTDPDILEFAKQQRALLISYDKDFGDLIFKKHYDTHGVVLVRLPDDLTSWEKAEIVVDFISEYQEGLFYGFSVIKSNKNRTIRILPNPSYPEMEWENREE
jgi:predicted nuclease of predicted toxin-antitoxin system